MKRILFIVGSLSCGGAEVLLVNYANLLSKYYDVTILTSENYHNELSSKLNANIKGIGDRVFSGCPVLKNIEYAGNKSSDITSIGIDIFDAQLTAINLYLPNVKSDDGSWDNFLGYDWKNKGSIIFGKSMPN